MKREMICIGCPMGCRLTAEVAGQTVTAVEGNHCKRGRDYAAQEAVCPMRVLTGTMKAAGCTRPFAVRSSAPIPKAKLLECAAALRRSHPPLPIHAGDVVIEDILGTKVQIIAMQNLDAQ